MLRQFRLARTTKGIEPASAKATAGKRAARADPPSSYTTGRGARSSLRINAFTRAALTAQAKAGGAWPEAPRRPKP